MICRGYGMRVKVPCGSRGLARLVGHAGAMFWNQGLWICGSRVLRGSTGIGLGLDFESLRDLPGVWSGRIWAWAL
jgi:hypothetical protein